MTAEDLTEELRTVENMRQALRWAEGRTPAARFVGAVGQDEFTFDVTVRVAPDTYVVFDTT